ncbi:Hsp20/alpha crystallin family protein [Devriesea agamarum]|uniref:Hsp20/alpha crystallin family protein n=1 Tax=Devriesea agamarum TaxID=472569 RepID=UPI00071C72BF|nr:Hsp20/alpha crystallin family protein [Devriesea agamarum]
MARSFNPLHEMDRILSDMTRTPASLAMPMDLFRNGDVFVAQVDLPGVDPASIDVDVEDRTLTIRAERTSAPADEDRQWLSHERPVGTFARQLTLGTRVALDRIEASYHDGVLELTIPMAEEAKPRKISVAHRDEKKTITGEADRVAE